MNTVRVAAITSLASIMVAVVSAYFQFIGQTRLGNTEGELKAAKEQISSVSFNSPGSLEQGQKLCRVLQGKTWRDSVIVPQNWNRTLCDDYAKKLGGNGFQLGCIKTDGTTLGGENGTLPSPNCGWN